MGHLDAQYNKGLSLLHCIHEDGDEEDAAANDVRDDDRGSVERPEAPIELRARRVRHATQACVMGR